MDDRLGNPQRAVLLLLMAEGREVSNVELRDLYGVTLTGKPREQLAALGLVTSRKVGRAFVHELSDQGWSWCADELSAARPPRAGSLGAALYGVLGGLARHLDRAGLDPRAVFAPAGGATTEASEGARGEEDVDNVEGRIRSAYQRLAAKPRDWVSLTDLRPLLGDAERAEVDAALVRMHRTPPVTIAPESNRKALTPADREAAVRIGGEDKHLLAIEGP